jgi:hypothetical protein
LYILLEFIFACDVRYSPTSPFCMWLSICPRSFVERTIFPLEYHFPFWILVVHRQYGLNFLLLILFDLYVYTFASTTMTSFLLLCSKSYKWEMWAFPLFFFKILWSILGPLQLPMNFGTRLSASHKLISWDSTRNCINGVGQFRKYYCFNCIEFYSPWAWILFCFIKIFTCLK